MTEKEKLHQILSSLWKNEDSVGKVYYNQALQDVQTAVDLQEEPVSIDFEQELYKAFGQVKDFTLGMRIAKWFYDMGKNSQEPVGEDLEVELKNYLNSDEYINILGVSGYLLVARHFANWQKNKMMEDAVDGVVAASAGGDGWVNIATGFVKSEDVNVKFGDKIKIIVVKED